MLLWLWLKQWGLESPVSAGCPAPPPAPAWSVVFHSARSEHIAELHCSPSPPTARSPAVTCVHISRVYRIAEYTFNQTHLCLPWNRESKNRSVWCAGCGLTFFRYHISASSLFFRAMPSYCALSSAMMAPRSGPCAASTSTFTCSLARRVFSTFISYM